MTDDEIKEILREADAVMGRYKDLVSLVLNELAERKSQAVWGVPGRYDGQLGCWEAGKDTICLHIKDGPSYSDLQCYQTFYDKIDEFEKKWRGDLKNIHISGHY